MVSIPKAPRMEDEKEPFYMRMNPMELDVQLQSAELIFRSILEGKRVPLAPHENIEAWERDTLGDDWVRENEKFRKEVLRQVKANGETTPAWMESLAHMGDIAWEMFEAGDKGERMRPLETIDRAEVIEQFKDLKHKVQMSYYARCGAGDKMFGFRACIAVLRTFILDSEMLELAVSVLTECITDHEYNRDGMACLTVPAPPLERPGEFKDRGWSFLRNALDAFVVQAGGTEYRVMKGEQREEPAINTRSKDVAVLIAKCVVRAKDAPAVLAQLKLVHEDPPEDCWIERRELRDIIPVAKKMCEDLNSEKPSEFLTALRDILVEGEAFVANAPAPEVPAVAALTDGAAHAADAGSDDPSE